MSHVFKADGTETNVRNLGWLLRHSGDVRSLGIYQNGLNGNEATLLATGATNGSEWVYYSPFASRAVCERWVSRRRFTHLHTYRSDLCLTLRELRGHFKGARA